MAKRKFRVLHGKPKVDNKPHRQEFNCRGRNCSCQKSWGLDHRGTLRRDALRYEHRALIDLDEGDSRG